MIVAWKEGGHTVLCLSVDNGCCLLERGEVKFFITNEQAIRMMKMNIEEAMREYEQMFLS